MTPIVSITSARLKTGKLKNSILMKSLTPPSHILSIRFPAVHAIRNAVVNRCIFFLMKRNIKAPIPIRLIPMMMANGTGNDRDIPKLNTGFIRTISLRYSSV